MATDYVIPLTPSQNSTFAIFINGVQYILAFQYANAIDGDGVQEAGWQLDLMDQNNSPLILGIPLVTGANLLAQFAYLGLGFAMFCYTAGNPSAPPTFNNLGGAAQVVVEFSAFRVRFHVEQKSVQAPGLAVITVTNLKDSTAKTLLPEFLDVSLSAGYQGNLGTIFKGTTRQTRIGQETPTDTYCEIHAADERGYNWGVINKTHAAGSTAEDHWKSIAQVLQPYGVTLGYYPQQLLASLKYPRAVTLYGNVYHQARMIAQSLGCTWSIQRGVLQMVQANEAIPGNVVVMNAQTGMIGKPEQSQVGIAVRALINPTVGVNTILQLNNADIQTATLNQTNTGQAQNTLIPSTDADGQYKVMKMTWDGDTRGEPWYMDMVCLAASGSGYQPVSTTSSAAENDYVGP
jgi:hypothetical protein